MNSGIYELKINNTYYVGSAKDFNKRYKRHLKDLRSGNHCNVILQRSFVKYGEENLRFSILKEIPYEKEIILLNEQNFIDEYRSKYGRRCANISQAAFGDTLTYNPNREQIVNNIGNGVRKWMIKLSEEERKEKFGHPGESNGMYGKTHSPEAIQKIKNRIYTQEDRDRLSIIQKESFKNNPQRGERLSFLASQRTGELNSFYGKTHSEETKFKIREKNKLLKPVNRIKLSIDGVEFDSYNDASKITGISVTTIRWRCLSVNKKFDNYIIIDKTK